MREGGSEQSIMSLVESSNVEQENKRPKSARAKKEREPSVLENINELAETHADRRGLGFGAAHIENDLLEAGVITSKQKNVLDAHIAKTTENKGENFSFRNMLNRLTGLIKSEEELAMEARRELDRAGLLHNLVVDGIIPREDYLEFLATRARDPEAAKYKEKELFKGECERLSSLTETEFFRNYRPLINFDSETYQRAFASYKEGDYEIALRNLRGALSTNFFLRPSPARVEKMREAGLLGESEIKELVEADLFIANSDMITRIGDKSRAFGQLGFLKAIGKVNDAGYKEYLEEIKKNYGRAASRSEWRDSPIKPDTIFTQGEELAAIRRAPAKERAAKLKEFKEKLSWQKEGFMVIQTELIKFIRRDPDASLGMLYEYVRDSAPKYGLTEEQKEIAKKILAEYTHKHEAVRAIRKEHPDDRELYQILFGAAPKGKIEIIEGPMTLYFRCHDVEDYARIRQHIFNPDQEPTRQDIEKADTSGGVSIDFAPTPELRGTIIAENAKGRLLDHFTVPVLRHEEQHAIKRLFAEQYEVACLWEALEVIKQTGKVENRANILRLFTKRYLRRAREYGGEERAKDEILAYFKGGNKQPSEILETLILSEEKGGLYDYFAERKEGFKEIVLNALKMENPSKKISDEELKIIDKSMGEVFGSEYRALLKDGIDAFVILREHGYSTEEAKNFLIMEPLRKWGKTVARALKAKELREKLAYKRSSSK